MTLEQLRLFVAVAERGHMTRAAEALGLTQSAVSAAVAALEARQQVRLFHRVGRGLELSEAGVLFLPEAKAVLVRAQRAAETLDDLAGFRRGRLRIAASQTIANYWLPPRLAAFATRYPAISITLTPVNTAQVFGVVAAGDCELGLIEGALIPGPWEAADVGGDRLSLYAAPGHPLARTGTVSLVALAQAAWVAREPGSGTRSEFEAALAARGVDPAALSVLIELPSNEAVLGAASRGDLIAAASDLVAASWVAAATLVRLPFDLVERRFVRLNHAQRPLSRVAAAFVANL